MYFVVYISGVVWRGVACVEVCAYRHRFPSAYPCLCVYNIVFFFPLGTPRRSPNAADGEDGTNRGTVLGMAQGFPRSGDQYGGPGREGAALMLVFGILSGPKRTLLSPPVVGTTPCSDANLLYFCGTDYDCASRSILCMRCALDACGWSSGV